MKIGKDYCENDFQYIVGRHIVFQSWNTVFVCDIDVGSIKIVGYVPNYIVRQSPNGENILVGFDDLYVIPTEIFIKDMLSKFNGQREQYKINVKFGVNQDCSWLDNVTIFIETKQFHSKIYYFCVYRREIYNIEKKKSFNIILQNTKLLDIAYFEDSMMIIILDNKIMVTDYDNVILEFPNYHEIVCYNQGLNLFINNDCCVYKRYGLCDLVRFQFIGDYERDYPLVPNYIKFISDCLLSCGLICDLVNEIYRQLLILDPVTSFVY